MLNKLKLIKSLFIFIFFFFILIRQNKINKEWIKYELNPVLGNIQTGCIFDPFVIKDNNLYKMFFSWRIKRAIALSTSKDGINWSSIKIVLDKGNITSWEEAVNRASVVMVNKKYYMWYTGQYNVQSKIGLAFSDDGYNFIKYKNNPVIIPEYNFEKLSVMNPHVIYDKEEKIFKMWYSAGEQYEPDVICYAISKDGINWIKYENNPIFGPNLNKSSFDFYKIGGCDVHKISNKKYIMFYIGYTDINTARIFIAISKNGIDNWIRFNYPIIQPTKDEFDHSACYKPSAVFDKKRNRWMLWYNGRNRSLELIGLAIHKNYEIYKFKYLLKLLNFIFYNDLNKKE